jgi:hypothetical protein
VRSITSTGITGLRRMAVFRVGFWLLMVRVRCSGDDG